MAADDDRSGDNAHIHSQAAYMSKQGMGGRCGIAALTGAKESNRTDTIVSRPTGAHTSANQSDQGGEHTESNCNMATDDDQLAAGNKHPQNRDVTHPDNHANNAKACAELLHSMKLEQPPASGTAARRSFELQLVAKVNRILKNQRQRAYRKAKKKGLLSLAQPSR